MNGTPGWGTHSLLESLSTLLSLTLVGHLLDEHPGEGGAFSEPFSAPRLMTLPSNSTGMKRRTGRRAPAVNFVVTLPFLLVSQTSALCFRVLPQKGSFALWDHISLNSHKLTPIHLSDEGFRVTPASYPSHRCLLHSGVGTTSHSKVCSRHVGWRLQSKITPALSLSPSHRSPGHPGHPSTVSLLTALPTPPLPSFIDPGISVSQNW